MDGPARIAILFETFQDFQIVKRHLARLTEWEVPYVLTAVSALKSPGRLARWIAEREEAGVEVFIVAVGGAASLAGAVAAQSDCPVIGVPLDTTPLRGQDALFAMAGLPVEVPVALVGVNSVENAFHFALRLLALRHPDYAALVRRVREEWPQKEIESLQNLRDQYPECFPPEASHREVPSPEPVPPAEKPTAAVIPVETPEAPPAPEPLPSRAPIAPPRGKARRIIVNPTAPDVAAIEEVADILLEGGVVGLPTDTVYGLAAVATNGKAVARLYEIKGRDLSKPIPILIHSTRGLARLVREIPEAARTLFDTYWPGALTLVFRKHPGLLAEITPADTIGLRMPDHLVALAVISMLARPLAVTSANLAGQPPALTADELLATFGHAIECVLDAGPTAGEKPSTVLSLAAAPFRILREGAISFDELKAILGDALAENRL